MIAFARGVIGCVRHELRPRARRHGSAHTKDGALGLSRRIGGRPGLEANYRTGVNSSNPRLLLQRRALVRLRIDRIRDPGPGDNREPGGPVDGGGGGVGAVVAAPSPLSPRRRRPMKRVTKQPERNIDGLIQWTLVGLERIVSDTREPNLQLNYPMPQAPPRFDSSPEPRPTPKTRRPVRRRTRSAILQNISSGSISPSPTGQNEIKFLRSSFFASAWATARRHKRSAPHFHSRER